MLRTSDHKFGETNATDAEGYDSDGRTIKAERIG